MGKIPNTFPVWELQKVSCVTQVKIYNVYLFTGVELTANVM